jgi:hypothetical protein
VGAAEEVASAAVKNGPVILVHRGVGFALNGSEFHVIKTHIVGVRYLKPAEMRALISSEKSIEEIRAELAENGTPRLKGYLRLGVHLYRLDNISVSGSGTNRTFTAEVASWDTEPAETGKTVGAISVTMMAYEGARVGDGELSMEDDTYYYGTYRVLLAVQPLLPVRLGAEK